MGISAPAVEKQSLYSLRLTISKMMGLNTGKQYRQVGFTNGSKSTISPLVSKCSVVIAIGGNGSTMVFAPTKVVASTDEV